MLLRIHAPLLELVIFNPFMPTVQTFAVRETDVSRHDGGRQSLGHQMLERWEKMD